MRRAVAGLILAGVLLAGSAAAQQKKQPEIDLQAAIRKETVDGDLKGAIHRYEKIVAANRNNHELAAKALVQLGQCYEKLGDAAAKKAYDQVLTEYADQQGAVSIARARLAALGRPGAGGLVTRRVLADASGVDGYLTPDGKYISHIDGDTGDVVQFEVVSGQTSRIANKGSWSEIDKFLDNEVFSRDGKQIVYEAYTLKDWVAQLRIRNLDGSGLRTLYSSEKDYDIRPLDWSPDARSILVLRGGPNKANELMLMSTVDGSVRFLRGIHSDDVTAGFSPDGRFVAFSFAGEGSPPNGDVFLMTADGRNEAPVARHPGDDQLLGWTPGGRGLIVLSDRSGTWDIWTVAVAGGKQEGEPELAKKNFGWDPKILGLAPNGSLYYQTFTSLGGLYSGAIDLETGKVLAPPAPAATRYTGLPYQLTWSPDGRYLAYLSHPGRIGPGNNILTIRSAATGEERFLSPRLRGVNQISWAPDSRSIIALGFTSTGTGAFRIDAETSEIAKLADEGVFPYLCPDGKTLVFLGEGGIRKRNLDTGEESEVVKTAPAHYSLSPDGREVAFQADGAIKTVSLTGGEPRELFRGSAQGYCLGWTRDGRNIMVHACGAANGEIWRVPAQAGAPLKLALSVPRMVSFTLHPDNRRFAFSASEGSRNELWVMENFLPAAKAAARQ